MKTFLILASATCLAWASAPSGRLDTNPGRRDVIEVGPSGICPAVPTITAELQPVYYCATCPCPTTINPFHSGIRAIESHKRSDSCTVSTVTRIIDPAESVPPQTPSVTSSASTTASPSNDLFIGLGLPLGTTSNLPDNNFIFLAVSAAPASTRPAKRHDVIPRQLPASISPLAVVDLTQPIAIPGGLDQDICDSASPLLLQDGRLLQFSNAVAKQPSELTPLMGFQQPPTFNQINVTFTLSNGILGWNAAELSGDATFYLCGTSLYAAFLGTRPAGCVSVIAGAIAGTACISRVQQTRAVQQGFTAPTTISTSIVATTTTSSMPSALSNSVSAPTSTSATTRVSRSSPISGISISTTIGSTTSSAPQSLSSSTSSINPPLGSSASSSADGSSQTSATLSATVSTLPSSSSSTASELRASSSTSIDPTTTTITTTTALTTTTTTTTTSTTTAPRPSCNAPNSPDLGAGGCSSDCFCDSSIDGGGFCTIDDQCGDSCSQDSDCEPGSFCTDREDAVDNCGTPICESTDGCTSSFLRPSCNAPNAPDLGAGGCSINCYCDSSIDGGGYCTIDASCSSPCSQDSDCAPGSFCTDREDAVANCGTPICESTDGCTSSLTRKKRTAEGMFGENKRAERIGYIRARWAEKMGAVCSRASCQNHDGGGSR